MVKICKQKNTIILSHLDLETCDMFYYGPIAKLKRKNIIIK